MSTLTLSRRSLLQWLGISAGALCIPGVPTAHAATGAPRRLIFVTTPHGTVRNSWAMPHLFSGSTDSSDLVDWEASLSGLGPEDMSPILAEFHDLRAKCLFLDGVVQASAICDTKGNNHTIGAFHSLTGANIPKEGEDVSSLPWQGMSVDQVIADRVMVPGRFRSLHLANIGRSGGETSGAFCRARGGVLIPGQSGLKTLWERLFGSTVPDTPVKAQLAAGRTSILDFLADRYDTSLTRVASSDRVKIETHREKLRDFELRINALANLECEIPDISVTDLSASALYQEVNQVQASLLQMAFSCDLTRVAHINISNGQRAAD